MNWKTWTIGKKIAVGFSVVIILLVFLGSLSFLGVGDIVNNADEVIDGNKLDGNLAQKEVDHLNWVNQVNALLTDHRVTTLNVETDDRQCGFGQWLYGEGRKQAETLVPSLAPLLKQIEKPHRDLHDSAIQIRSVFKQPHTELALTLSNRLNDHLNWVSQVGKSLSSEAGGLYSYQAQLKNVVDQTVSLLETIQNNPELTDTALKHQTAYQMTQGLRYGPENKDYFFILNTDGIMMMHPYSSQLEGRDLNEIKDPSGKRFFAEMGQVCEAHGEGFVTYQWPLPGTDQPAPKISYVKLYKPWNWIVGTGVYLDHTNPVLLKRADDFAAGQSFSTGVQLDPTQCAFGRFLADPETQELASGFPQLKTALDAIREPHNALHKSASDIEHFVNQLQMQKAIQIFNQETQEALRDVEHYFQDAIDAEKNLQNGLDEANRIYAQNTVKSLSQVQALLAQIRTEAKAHILTDRKMLESATRTRRNVAIVAVVAIITGILLAFFIARGIMVTLTKISAGLKQGANQVASAAGQVSASSQQMAEGASQQAASIEETSSSMEEMASMTKTNSQNAGQADGLMHDANAVVKKSDQSMKQLITSMEEITKASDETSKIIKTIDEIAFQTNLLALNAAVEAARAGEAGAGFAVVADEVRNLAVRAAEAAKNTADLIQETLVKVEDGSKLVLTTNEAFADVSESTGKVSELIAEISHASKEQADGIEQVSSAVSQMDKIVQQNAATAEESASAAEEMNAQSEQLKDFVGDLMIMVTGKKDLRIKENDDEREESGASALGFKPVKNDKSLDLKKGEVRPHQIIPFDDDEDFKDF